MPGSHGGILFPLTPLCNGAVSRDGSGDPSQAAGPYDYNVLGGSGRTSSPLPQAHTLHHMAELCSLQRPTPCAIISINLLACIIAHSLTHSLVSSHPHPAGAPRGLALLPRSGPLPCSSLHTHACHSPWAQQHLEMFAE